MDSSTNSTILNDLIDQGSLGLLPWALQYLPHHFEAAPAEFHRIIAEDAENYNNLVVAAPRGHAKTTLMALAFPLYRAAVFHEPYTLIVSDTATQAEQRTADIYAELNDNEALIDRYPHLALPEGRDYKRAGRAKRTARDFITVGTIRMTAAGAGQSLRGIKTGKQRPSLILVDDLENDENVLTFDQREKLKNWFLKSLSNLPGHGGATFVVIGTILHEDGLLAWLLKPENGLTWRQHRFQAIQYDGEPLWPAAWPIDRLEAQRLLIGDHAFSSEFQNLPIAPGSRRFAEATYYTSLPEGPFREGAGFDAAYSAKTHSNATVTIKGRWIDGKIYITDMLYDRLPAEKYIPLMKASGVTRITWIRSTIEKGLESLLRREGIAVNAINARGDKLSRAQDAIVSWNRGDILVPHGKPFTRRLVDEVTSFTGIGDTHDDIVDAMVALHRDLIGKRRKRKGHARSYSYATPI